MARTKQTARKSTGTKAPRKNLFGGYDEDEEENIDLQSIWPTMESPSPITPEQQELVDKEERYRDLFGNNRSSSEISDPHVLLNDVFVNSFQFQDESTEEKAIPKILTKSRVTGRKGNCFNNQQQFLQNWKKFTNGILDGLDWNNVFAAGGSVLANAATGATEESFGASDIDLFIYGFENDEQANKKLEHIYSVVTKHNKDAKIVRSFRAVTILGTYPDYRHVQIILKLYKSPAEVLLGFDVDCCTVGFDGKTVLAMDRCVRAVSKGYNLVNMHRRSLTYETRLRKYSKRGFAVAVPNLDKAQVDVSLFKQSATDVQGLAKLLIYEYYEINPPFYTPGKSYSTHKIIPRRYQYMGETMNSDNIDIVRDITGEEDSDYAEFIPWGPSWYSHTILNMLEYKDRASAFSGGRVTFTKRPGGNNNNKEKPAHVHSYVTGIKGVIEGSSSNFWCRYCKQNRPLEQGEDGKDVCGPLHWVKEYQAYQDIDKGFRRSFGGQTNQPVLQENWTEGVYSAAYQARDAPHPLKPAPKSPVKATAPLLFASSPVRSSVPSSDLFVSGAGQHFESQNQMLRHQRDNFGSQKEGPSPFGNNVEAFGGRPSVDIFSQNVNAFGGGTLPFYTTVTSDTPSKSTVVRNLNSPSKSFTSTTAPLSSFSSNNNNNNNNNNSKFATNTAVFNAGKPAITVAPAWWSLFTPGQGSASSQMSYTGQALLLVAALYRKGGITLQLKAELKDLIIDNDPLVRSVVEAFFIDNDIVELVDSFTRVLSIKRR